MIFEHNPFNLLTRYIVNRCPIDAAAILLSAGETKWLMRQVSFADIHNRYYLFFPQAFYSWLGGLEKYLSITRLGGQYCTAGRKL